MLVDRKDIPPQNDGFFDAGGAARSRGAPSRKPKAAVDVRGQKSGVNTFFAYN